MRVRTVLLTVLLLFPAAGRAAEKVTLQLRWDHQFQFAGYYAAKWRGYYADAGFDVEIRPAVLADGTILKAVEEVAKGRADFGVGAADILIARDRGVDLVVLASIFQRSAAAFFALEKTPLDSPKDLLGLRVARNVGDLIDIEFQAMLRAEGIDPTKIEPYPHEPGIAHVVEGRVDVMPGYRITSPFLFRKKGIGFKMLLPASYGVDFYGDSLFTHRRMVDRDTDAVERFVGATGKGWIFALEHPGRIADRIAAELPRTEELSGGTFRELNRFQIDAVKKLTHHPVLEVGHINPHRWHRMNEFLREVGIVKTDLDTGEFIFDPQRLNAEREHRRHALIKTILLVLTPLILLGGIFDWIWTLRRSIARKTDELRESRNKYRTLFEAANDAIFVAAADTDTILDANRKAETLIGRSKAEIIGLHQTELHPNEQRESARCSFRDEADYRKGDTYRYFDVLTRAGGRIPVEISQASIEIEGKPCVLGIFRDVSEQKKAEKALKESEARFRLIFEQSTAGIAIASADGCFIDANQAICDMLGYTREELLRLTVLDVTLPEDRDFSIQTDLPILAGEQDAYRLEKRYRHKEGRTVWADLSSSVIRNDHGDIRYAVSVVVDTSERKRTEIALKASEEKFRKAFDTDIVAIAISRRLDGMYLDANPGFQKVTGYGHDEIVGRTSRELGFLSSEQRAELVVNLKQKGRLDNQELTYSSKSGEWKTILFSIGSIILTGEDCFLATMVDITERKKAEEDQENALVEKEVLLREIHHRVKNNMQVIISLLRMHARKNQDPHLKVIFDECRGRIEAMSLIHEALYQSDETARIDFGAYLRKLCRNLSQVHCAAEKGIRVNADPGNVALTMDQGIAVGMVIAELISNAFKHAFPAGRAGDVAVGMAMRDAETVELIVADDGKGLPADFDMSASRSLGMRLVWGAVTRELGGSIEATNDRGAKFVLRFKQALGRIIKKVITGEYHA